MERNLQDYLTECQQEKIAFDYTSYPCNIVRMKIGERIKLYRENIKITQSELARRIGVKPQSVQAWEAGKNGPSRKRIQALAKELRISEEELEFGSMTKALSAGEPPRTIIDVELVGENPPVPYNSVSSLDDKYVFIPRYEAGISAGHGYHNGDHVEVSKTHAYRWDWIRKNGWRPEDLCVIEASGHSMEPRISDGDVLLVNMDDKEFQSGKVYVLSFPHEGLRAKRIHRLADGRVKISSDNPDKASFPDEYYSPEEASHLNIVGRVVQRGGEI
ncbi:MAG: XRE family transcriptional regulator [Leptospirillum sp.]